MSAKRATTTGREESLKIKLRQTTLRSASSQRNTHTQEGEPPSESQSNREEADLGITTKEEAIKFLTENNYYSIGTQLNILTISDIMLRLHNKPNAGGQKHILNAVKHIANLLKAIAEETPEQSARDDKIVEAIKEARGETTKELETQREELRGWKETLAAEGQKKGEKIDEIAEGLKALGERLTNMEKVKETRDQVEQTQTQMPTSYENNNDYDRPRETGKTYATVVGTTGKLLAKGHAAAQARGEEAEKQMILSATNQKGGTVAAELKTETELLTKANSTLQLMMEEGETTPTRVRSIKFVGAFRTRTGAVIYTLNTKEAAEWMRSPDVLRRFKEKFGEEAEARAKHFSIIAYYVPVSFNLESDEARRKVEKDNYLS